MNYYPCYFTFVGEIILRFVTGIEWPQRETSPVDIVPVSVLNDAVHYNDDKDGETDLLFLSLVQRPA